MKVLFGLPKCISYFCLVGVRFSDTNRSSGFAVLAAETRSFFCSFFVKPYKYFYFVGSVVIYLFCNPIGGDNIIIMEANT